MNEPLDSFFEDFGSDVIVNGARVVRGIFDAAYGEAFGGMLGGAAPTLRVKTGAAVLRGNTVSVLGTAYAVTGVEPDGTGLDLLRLEKQ